MVAGDGDGGIKIALKLTLSIKLIRSLAKCFAEKLARIKNISSKTKLWYKLKFLEESFALKSSVRNKLKVGDLIHKFSGRKVLAHKKLVFICIFFERNSLQNYMGNSR